MSIKKIILIFLGFLIFIAIISISIYLYEINSAVGKSSQGIEFSVEKGQSVREISSQLFEHGLIRSKWAFEFYVKLNHKQSKLQAGEYVLMPIQNIKEIVESLGNGKEQVVKILIKEGEEEANIAVNLEQQGLLRADDFLNITGKPFTDYRTTGKSLPNFSSKYSFLNDKPDYYSLEGYLFPDTYIAAKNSTPEQVVEKILDNFDKKLTPVMRDEIVRQGKTIYEVMIMASIVEKEVKTLEDMKIVSGIFWQRITNGQALQSDATLSYVLDDKTAAHNLEQLKTDSPFNSYKFKGLPPTPIGNPGINAIIAAIYPTHTDYNFFLTPKDSDQTIFSRTFEEHIRNKQKYLK